MPTWSEEYEFILRGGAKSRNHARKRTKKLAFEKENHNQKVGMPPEMKKVV